MGRRWRPNPERAASTFLVLPPVSIEKRRMLIILLFVFSNNRFGRGVEFQVPVEDFADAVPRAVAEDPFSSAAGVLAVEDMRLASGGRAWLTSSKIWRIEFS